MIYQIPKDFCQFYIVRHGETTFNKRNIIQGHSDINLTTEAIKKTRELGRKLKNISFSATFCSNLIRARKTAEIIQSKKSLIISSKLIKDRRMGILEGRKASTLNREQKRLLNLSGKTDESNILKANKIESIDELCQRLNYFFNKTTLAYKNKRVLVITHAGIIGRLIINAKYKGAKSFEDLKIANLSYLILNSNGVEYQIAGVNNIDIISNHSST